MKFGFNKNEYNEEIKMEKLSRLAEQLVGAYVSKLSPDELQRKMTNIIKDNGLIFLGRGQNRLAFMFDGDEYCYKVPYREIGFRDNFLERNISALITSSADVYNKLGDHFALVTDFRISDDEDMCNFMICQEFIPNVEGTVSSIGMTTEEKAIYGIAENSNLYVETCELINQYFHIIDAHPRKAANNWGVKNDKLCIRDYGYFIPRVGDLADATSTINDKNGGSIDVIYLYNSLPNIMANNKLSVDEKIEALMKSANETWYPADENGNQVGDDKNLVDAEYIGKQLLQAYINTL